MLRKEYDIFLTRNHTEDLDIKSWPLMENAWPLLTITCCYLYFVLKFGTQMMENRKPYKLNRILVFYNVFMVLGNIYICILGAVTFAKYQASHIMCSLPSDKQQANSIAYAVNSIFWYFTMTKVIELLDTVFFVLRKKQSQISTLHVYHHSNMALTTWLYVKFQAGEQSLPVVLANALIHIFMYTYYSLAAFGVNMNKYLTWKKLMTKIQLLQFVLIIIYMLVVIFYDCWSKGLVVAMTFNTATFLLMFVNFYRTTYVVPDSKKRAKE